LSTPGCHTFAGIEGPEEDEDPSSPFEACTKKKIKNQMVVKKKKKRKKERRKTPKLIVVTDRLTVKKGAWNLVLSLGFLRVFDAANHFWVFEV
jgi:hypothetical protein